MPKQQSVVNLNPIDTKKRKGLLPPAKKAICECCEFAHLCSPCCIEKYECHKHTDKKTAKQLLSYYNQQGI